MRMGKQLSFQTKALAVVVLAMISSFVPQATAFWRLPCQSPLLVERADPIVNPDAVSGHLHTIMGGNGFNFTMDYAKARASTCSTCTVTEDFSNYWIPSLFYQAQNGSFHPVQQVGGATIYYLQRRAEPDEKLYAFPEGFRMVAGDPMLRSYSDDLSQGAISFACIDYNNPSAEINGLPNNNCPNGLRAQVFFPSCWDGNNLDSPDHKSHMAYPNGIDNGACPSTHPVRFISIFYEVLFNVDEWKDQWYGSKQPFVFSNGDPTGYGLHGDFLNGWDVPVLQDAVNNCNASSGTVEECSSFKFFPDTVTSDCFVPPRIHEQTSGWIDTLPGCNPVQPGPERAVAHTDCGATTVIGEPQRYDTDVSSKGWEYVGCARDQLDSRTLPERTASDDMTVPKCVDYCIDKGFSYAGLEYASECYCGDSVASERQIPSKCLMPCAGNSTQICGDSLRLSLYKKSSGSLLGASASSVSVAPLSVPRTSADIAPVFTSRSTSTMAITVPTNTPGGTPGWISRGCWIDPVNPRVLETVGYWGQEITTSGCIKYCDSKGFKFAGTENGGQCFCSDSLNGGSAAISTQCGTKCKGDAVEICGGPARLSLYEKTL
ncbi:hypothetical protein RUND412_003453 [Rhizina undulata]